MPSSCSLCGQVGHDIRTCNWDNIERLHNLGRRLYINLQIRNTEYRASLCAHWRAHLKKNMRQILIKRYASPELVRDYATIQEWRQRDTGLFDSVPQGPIVSSRLARKDDLDLMLDIVYSHISTERVQLSPDMILESRNYDLGMEIRDRTSVFRRGIIHRSLTNEGFDGYLDQMIGYLQNIRNTHQLGNAPPVLHRDYLNNTNAGENWNIDDIYELTTGREIRWRSSRSHDVEQFLQYNCGKKMFNIQLQETNLELEGDCGVCWEENNNKNIMTNCQHRFCSTCIIGIMKMEVEKKTDRIIGEDIILDIKCPMCRGEITHLTYNTNIPEIELNEIRQMVST
jgi:hypothetical protein